MKRRGFILGLALTWGAMPLSAACRLGLLSVHVVGDGGVSIPDAAIYLYRNSSVPEQRLAPDRFACLPAGRYWLQAALLRRNSGRINRALSEPLAIDLMDEDTLSVVLPLRALGGDLLAAAVVNERLFR